jgi:hypothetical protein
MNRDASEGRGEDKTDPERKKRKGKEADGRMKEVDGKEAGEHKQTRQARARRIEEGLWKKCKESKGGIDP